MTESVLAQLQALLQVTKYIDPNELDLPNARRTTCELFAALNELRRFVHQIEDSQ